MGFQVLRLPGLSFKDIPFITMTHAFQEIQEKKPYKSMLGELLYVAKFVPHPGIVLQKGLPVRMPKVDPVPQGNGHTVCV